MIRSFFAWVYNWITVLAGIVSGALAFGMPFLGDVLSLFDTIGVVDLTPFGISTATALKITSTVALLKGLHAWWMSRRAVA